MLGTPFRDLNLVQEHSREYLEKTLKTPPWESAGVFEELFRELLLSLTNHDENYDRILSWTLMLGGETYDKKKKNLVREYDGTLVRFTRGKRDRGRFVPDDELEWLTVQYVDRVLRPHSQFREDALSESDEWLERPERRSRFDELLWRQFFSEVCVDPALYAVNGYHLVLFRQWWSEIIGQMQTGFEENFARENCRNVEVYSGFPSISGGCGALLSEALMIGLLPDLQQFKLN